MSDFEYYCDEFGGCAFDDEEEFARCLDKAKRFVKYVTYTEPDFEDDDVRSCICALAEIYADHLGGGIVGEKIDDYEAEYSTAKYEDELMHTVRLYLPPVILYRGF